ncbi:UDP-N-acetylmuramate--L-alanine ligase [Bienertia sinuspersici]
MSCILCWNCRGLGNPAAINTLRGVLSTENLHIVFLSETKLKAGEMEKLKEKLKFEGILAVNCMGEGRQRSGGLALLWKMCMNVQVKSFSTNHIDVWVQNYIPDGWRFTSIYGFPEDENKHRTRLLLEGMKDSQNIPSNNLPILLTMKGYPHENKKKRRKKHFRFEEMWLRDDSSEEVIQKAWGGGGDQIESIVNYDVVKPMLTEVCVPFSTKNFGPLLERMSFKVSWEFLIMVVG